MDINRGSFQVVASHQICDKYGAPVAYTFREDDATLYAAAPELFEYVESSAMNGCATAKALIAKATGDDQ